MQGDLGALGQVVEDFVLESPQEERRDDATQPRTGFVVAGALHRFAEVVAELLLGAEQARVQEAEQGVEIHQVVLDGRAGGDDAKVRGELASGPGPLRERILDGLRLVQHRAVPRDRGERFDVVLQQTVGGEVEVERRRVVQQRRARRSRAGVDLDVQRRRESTRLVDPVGDDGRGGDHQRRSFRGPLQEHGEGLHGLAKTHVVREARTGTPTA